MLMKMGDMKKIYNVSLHMATNNEVDKIMMTILALFQDHDNQETLVKGADERKMESQQREMYARKGKAMVERLRSKNSARQSMRRMSEGPSLKNQSYVSS